MRLRTLKLLTIAPELDGALDAIRTLDARGVAVSIGHTDATYEQARRGLSPLSGSNTGASVTGPSLTKQGSAAQSHTNEFVR